MGKRIAVAAAALVAVLGAAWFLQRRADREASFERREARLLTFDERGVTAFTITGEGRVARFEKGTAGWRMVSPVGDAASAEAIARVLGATRSVRVIEVVAEPEALASYGLDPPRLVLKLEGVEAPELAIGQIDPIGHGLFARVTGRPGVLLLGPPEAGTLATLTASGLRDSSPTGVPRGDVERIVIARGAATTGLVRGPDGWWIDEPRRLPASDNAVDRLLSALDGIQIPIVNDAAERSDPRFGLGDGALEITLSTSSVKRILTFGGPTPEGLRYASRDDRDSLLIVNAAALDEAPFDVAALLDTRLTKLNRYAVARATWTTSAGEFVASRRDEDTWVVGGTPTDAPRMLSFLASALEMPVSGWDAGDPRTPVVASLTVAMDSGASERVDFHEGNLARVASLPGGTFRVRPPLPSWPTAEAK